MQNSESKYIRRWVRLTKAAIKSQVRTEEGYPIHYNVVGNGKPIGCVIRVLVKKPNFQYLVDIRLFDVQDMVRIKYGVKHYEFYITDIKAILSDIPVWWKIMKRRYANHLAIQEQTRKLRKAGLIGRKYREQW